MNSSQFKRLFSLVPTIALTYWSSSMDESLIRTIALILIWITCLMYAFPILNAPLIQLRKFPAFLWILWLLGLIAAVASWILNFQPAIGILTSPIEYFWLIATAATLIFLPFAGWSRLENIRMGWTANLFISITTFVFLVIFLEMGLRYFWVSSDNFQFSKMHQNWSRLYWNPINELGYRDFAPPNPNDGRIHILVAGDSLASGYGINRIEDTFPHQLNAILGENYTVNIAAQPGWGVALEAAQSYPIKPDILILSHYINDINEGNAGRLYGRGFPQIRLEPDENLLWWLDNFYLANFLYYRVFLYTQHDAVGLYNDWVYGAYADEGVWAAYEEELQAVIDWTAAENIELIVLLWPNLRDIAGSKSLTDPVGSYFNEQGVRVVDMGEILVSENPTNLTVNLFDAHPSIYSHERAAEALAAILQPNN